MKKKLKEIEFLDSKMDRLEKRVKELEDKDRFNNRRLIDNGSAKHLELLAKYDETRKSNILIKGKWYVDEEGYFGKHDYINSVGNWYYTESYCYGNYNYYKGCYCTKPTREANQSELDSFLPEGHPDRSDAKPYSDLKKGDVCLVWDNKVKVKTVRVYHKDGLFMDGTTDFMGTYDHYQKT